jgi:hypothetical protein
MRMARKAKKTVGRRLKRNPVARSLSGGLYRQKVEPRPDKPRRKPKHKKPIVEEDEGG